MTQDLNLLLGTAAAIGFLHTLLGPDHYLPFIMMSRAQRWSRLKTVLVTVFCGAGHVLSSVVLGFAGIALGLAVASLEAIEAARGEWAAWGLIAFGLVYAVWGLRKAMKSKPHTHWHQHEDGCVHTHEHNHHGVHAHAHAKPESTTITPWVLFTVFVLGPCEPLIPILMYPAAKHSALGVILVTAVFGFVTILTMVAVVAAVSAGLNLIPFGRLERYTHALAGAAICISGLAITLLGL